MSPDLPDLRGIALFERLPDEILVALSREAQRRHLPRGAVVFSEGTPARAVHVLMSGFVKMVQSTPDGARIVLRYVAPGEPFGTPAFLQDGRYPGDAIAASNVVELQWPTRTMRSLLLKHPQMAVNALAILETRLKDLECRLMELSNEAVERRVARTIVRLVRKTGLNLAGKLEVPFPLTRQDLADMTGTTLHTVSRTLSVWAQKGLVERGRQRLVVTDLEALAGLAKDSSAGEASPRRTRRRRAVRV